MYSTSDHTMNEHWPTHTFMKLVWLSQEAPEEIGNLITSRLIYPKRVSSILSHKNVKSAKRGDAGTVNFRWKKSRTLINIKMSVISGVFASYSWNASCTSLRGEGEGGRTSVYLGAWESSVGTTTRQHVPRFGGQLISHRVCGGLI